MKYIFVFLLLIIIIVSVTNIKCESVKTQNEYLNITNLVHPKSSKYSQKSHGACQKTLSTNETLLPPIISVDKEALEEYLKDIDLSIIPGFAEDDGIRNWIPSKQMKKDLPTYLSGFDRENRPIWVVEYGKQKFYKYATSGKEMQAMFHRYSRQCVYTCLKSMAFKSTKEKPVYQYNVILDVEGLKPADMLDPRVLQLQLKRMSDFRRWTEKHICRLVFINVNPISENLLNLGRYFLLRILGKFDVYGTNKAFWGPKLLQTFPKDQIPEKYGGCKGFQRHYVV